MATKKQIAANRRNARLSTGPKSPAGKAASSMNNVSHGVYANTAILPSEDADAFKRLLAGFEAHYLPQKMAEQSLVEELANTKWRLARVEVYESLCYKAGDPFANAVTFAKMTAISNSLKRSLHKTCAELDRLAKARGKGQEQSPDPPEPDGPGKPGGAAVELWWINPETGERTLAAQSPAARAIRDLSAMEMKPQADPNRRPPVGR